MKIENSDIGLSSYFINFKKDNPNVNGNLVQSESYKLIVFSENSTIDIISNHASGIFYGVQSLLSLAEGNKGWKNFIRFKRQMAPLFFFFNLNTKFIRVFFR